MPRVALGPALALCALLAAPAAAGPDPSAELERGRLAYKHGDYKTSISTVRPLVYPSIALSSETDTIDAYRLLALSYFFENDEKSAQREFETLLNMAPDFDLDPLIESPPAVAFFREVRKRMADKIKELKDRQERERLERERKERERKERERKLREAMRERLVITRVEKPNIFALNFVPFGVPQFQNGHRTKGKILLGTQLLTGGLSAGIWIYHLTKYAGGTVPHDEVQDVRGQQIVQGISGGLFVALWAYGIGDGWYYYKKSTISEKRELVRPQAPPLDVPSFPSEPAAERPRSTTWLSPYLVPDGLGLGVGGTF